MVASNVVLPHLLKMLFVDSKTFERTNNYVFKHKITHRLDCISAGPFSNLILARNCLPSKVGYSFTASGRFSCTWTKRLLFESRCIVSTDWESVIKLSQQFGAA